MIIEPALALGPLQPLDAPRLRAAVDRLAAIDPDVARALARIGYPPPRVREPGFATLLRIVVAQQLSTRAAAAIWGRLEAALGGNVTPAGFAALGETELRAIGFSLRKALYGRELAALVTAGGLAFDQLAKLGDDEIVAQIAALRGFGRWSAEVYCLFALGRIDVFPADDLALQVAAMRLKRLEVRPAAKPLRALAEAWRPLRGAAALFLWHYYGAATLDEARP
jgi:DNA-3-methyladenine glycosylase II